MNHSPFFSFTIATTFLLSLLFVVISTTTITMAEARVETTISPKNGMMMIKTNSSSPWSYACTSNATIDTETATSACVQAGFRFVHTASIEIVTAPATGTPINIAAGLVSCSPNPSLSDSDPCLYEDFTVGAPSCAADFTKTLKLICTGVRSGGEFGVFMGESGDTMMRIHPSRDRLQARELFQSIWSDSCPIQSSSPPRTIASKLCQNFGLESGNFFDSLYSGKTSLAATISNVYCPSSTSTTNLAYDTQHFNTNDFAETCTFSSVTTSSSCYATSNRLGLHCRSAEQGTLTGDYFVTVSGENRLLVRQAGHPFAVASPDSGHFKGVCKNNFLYTSAKYMCAIMDKPTDDVSYSAGVQSWAVAYSPATPEVVPVSTSIGLNNLYCYSSDPPALGQCTYSTITSGCSTVFDQIELHCASNEAAQVANVVDFLKFVVPIVVLICIVSFVAMRWRMHRAEEEQMARLNRENEAKEQAELQQLQQLQQQQQQQQSPQSFPPATAYVTSAPQSNDPAAAVAAPTGVVVGTHDGQSFETTNDNVPPPPGGYNFGVPQQDYSNNNNNNNNTNGYNYGYQQNQVQVQPAPNGYFSQQGV